MPSGTLYAYNNFYEALMKAGIDLSSATLKVALLTNAYTPDTDAHDNFDDVSAAEVSGTGYSAGGATLANKTVTQDNVNNLGVFDADDVSWAASTITARYAVIYKSTGTPANDTLIAYMDFGSDLSTSSSTFSINWNAGGIIRLGQR